MIQAEKVTRFLTSISPELLDKSLIFLARNKSLARWMSRAEQRKLRGLSRPKKILVVPDINIGDALLLQSFIQKIKDCFPDSQIHYIYQYKAHPLIKNNPYIENQYPLFKGKGIPASSDTAHLLHLLKSVDYDIIFNICPYFSPKLFRSAGRRALHSIRLMAEIIKSYAEKDNTAHLAHRAGEYAADLAEKISGKKCSQRAGSHYQTYFFADEEVIQKTEKAIRMLHVDTKKTTILFNPDSASLYTFIPFALQLDLLEGILSLETVEQLLINCGRTFKHIEKSILNSLPEKLKEKIIIIPENIPIDVYAALSDHAKMFISGDTGPMHIAAAHKILLESPGYFNNATALVGIFGGTSSKIYGYDSFSDSHLSPSQNAPAKVFEGRPSCKNLTCIDKIYKKCKQIRCFEGVNCSEILHYIESYLRLEKTVSTPFSSVTFNPINNIENQRDRQQEKGQKNGFPFPKFFNKFIKTIKP